MAALVGDSRDDDVEQHHIVKRIEIVMEVMEQC